MNTEIRKIIEKIESDQQELERLVQERTVIMKNERHLSTGNFRRELAIIENFIRRISEEIILLNTSSSRYIEYNKVKNSIRDELSKYLIKETGNKPMIITVMQEI